MVRRVRRGWLARGGEIERIEVKKGDTCAVENNVEGAFNRGA